MTPEVREEIRQLSALDADISRGVGELEAELAPPRVPVSALGPAQSNYHYAWHDGTKFPGGYGSTPVLWTDYWALRARSAELFERNLYARGLIRRLVTNEINTGLHLEATPEEGLLGYEEEELADWTEETENRFRLWERAPRLCDHREQCSFGALQAEARREALVAGDVLVVLRQDQRTKLPRIQLIGGSSVVTPLATPRRGNRIRHGVELDGQDRQVAYWVRQRDGSSKRLPAYGEKSGRRLAWLLYGTDKRLDAVRGQPLLGLVLQSLKEIDRYRDSTQRKAVINSMLALFIKKTEERMGSRPMTGGAVRRAVVTDTGPEGDERTYNTADFIPGLILDELQVGEEPVAFQTNGTLEQLGTFEEAIIQAVAWANETPPEILRLAFSNNYSASQAAINEFKIYLNRVRTLFGETFCQPIYTEWLLAEAMAQRVKAPGLIDAWRDSGRFVELEAWTTADWSGHIKPSTDIFKQARGYQLLVEEGFITRDRASRELTGTKFSKNVKKLRRENEQLAEAREPIADTEPAANEAPRASLALIEGDGDEGDEGDEPDNEERATG